MFPPFRPTAPEISSITAHLENKTLGKANDTVPAEPVEELDFTEDPPVALLILLRIAHFQFNEIPSKIHAELLLEIALLCDQYDCVALVKPWLSQWLGDEQILLRESWQFTPIERLLRERWLFIAWVFGRQHVFEGLSQSIRKDLGINGDGACELLGGPMPLGLIGVIFSLRSTNQ